MADQVHGRVVGRVFTTTEVSSHRLRKFLTTKRSRVLAVGLFALLASVTACGEEVIGTPTLAPARTVVATQTPLAAETAKARVREIFESQVAAIKRDDWAAVYQSCSPSFRSSRNLARYVQDASAQFARDGYTAEGFEARNVEPFVRAPDRLRVKWDAYQNGVYIRTEEVGETYIFTQGDWFDDGAWCR